MMPNWLGATACWSCTCIWSSMFFEGNPVRFGPGENATVGIQDFTQKSTRDERRKLVKNFWQD